MFGCAVFHLKHGKNIFDMKSIDFGVPSPEDFAL
jgi:hypothetical protein